VYRPVCILRSGALDGVMGTSSYYGGERLERGSEIWRGLIWKS